jgi:hypothetical protein
MWLVIGRGERFEIKFPRNNSTKHPMYYVRIYLMSFGRDHTEFLEMDFGWHAWLKVMRL